MIDSLQLRQLIPPLTARTLDGVTVRAWDYKQKRNLVIAMLHADCPNCKLWLSQLTARAAELVELESVGMIIFSESPPRSAELLPTPFVAAVDPSGQSHRAFLGKTAFGPAGQDRVGVFVTDRYGELYAQWSAREASEIPAVNEILKPILQIQMAC